MAKTKKIQKSKIEEGIDYLKSSDMVKKLVNFLFNLSDNLPQKIRTFKSTKKFYIIVLIAGILLLGIYKKDWLIAATVNGSPITGFELQTRLNSQFKTQILNQMVNEKIILMEAQKANAIPSDTEIDSKISELEQNVGGAESLNGLITQQGQTRETLRDQIRLQLAISKLYDSEASVSAIEVEEFIKQNSASLQSTDSAKQKLEAFDFIKQQKISEIFSQKFQELRQKANIQIF